MGEANIFRNYRQEEDHFTNSLISILSLSRAEYPDCVPSFLRQVLNLEPNGIISTFRVLKGIEGTADGELSGGDCCIRVESKIVSATLRSEQISDHLTYLHDRPERIKRLVLLTPDDSRSQYIQKFVSLDPNRIVHVGWMNVFNFLATYAKVNATGVFAGLVNQFLDRIHENVFQQDMAGVILKINLSEKDVAQYLTEMAAGEWTAWNTPRKYEKLDGTGRKMLLFDRARSGITVEVEIDEVTTNTSDPGYPCTNKFAPETLKLFDPPIPLNRIRSLEGFKDFGVHKKDRTPYRNITRSQYEQLTSEQSTVAACTPSTESSSDATDSALFTLCEGFWYAAEFIGEEFGNQLRSYSPIRVLSLTVGNTSRDRFTMSFYHANYPEGVCDKIYTLQMIERTRTFVLARSLEHVPARLLLIYEISWAWLTEHFQIQAQTGGPDVQHWPSTRAGHGTFLSESHTTNTSKDFLE